jgi:hypothetical protein
MSIRRYYHQFKETELNTANANLKCYTPSKLNKSTNTPEPQIKEVPVELAQHLLIGSSKICFNSNFNGWFYKLCPLKLAQQVLPYKKRDDDGNEFTEVWALGQKDYNETDLYTSETNDTDSYTLEKTQYVMVEDRLAKIYNYDLSQLKKYDTNLVIDYSSEELSNYTGRIDAYHNNVTSYLKDNPESIKIPVQRRILKLINKHLLLLDSPFPFPKTQNEVTLNLIKLKKSNEVDHAFNLLVYDEFVYCYKCEFFIYYEPGDSLVIVTIFNVREMVAFLKV